MHRPKIKGRKGFQLNIQEICSRKDWKLIVDHEFEHLQCGLNLDQLNKKTEKAMVENNCRRISGERLPFLIIVTTTNEERRMVAARIRCVGRITVGLLAPLAGRVLIFPFYFTFMAAIAVHFHFQFCVRSSETLCKWTSNPTLPKPNPPLQIGK